MTRYEAERWAYELARLTPAHLTYVRPSTGYGWAVVAQDVLSREQVTLPDAASCAAYRDARRGGRAVPGAPDFGAGGL